MGTRLDGSFHDTSTDLSLMFSTFTGVGLSGGTVGGGGGSVREGGREGRVGGRERGW